MENTRNLAVAFANTVTVKTADENERIARKGDATLFRALQQILPQVIRVNFLFHSCFRVIDYGYKKKMPHEHSIPEGLTLNLSLKSSEAGPSARSKRKALQICGQDFPGRIQQASTNLRRIHSLKNSQEGPGQVCLPELMILTS